MSEYTYLEEVFDSFGIITVTFTANAFDFFDLARFAGSLDIFEMNVGILWVVDDGAKEVKKTLKGFEGLKDLCEGVSA